MSDDETPVTVKIYVENFVRLNPPKIVQIVRNDLRLDEHGRFYRVKAPRGRVWSFARLKEEDDL